jgi:hypothetical protein
MTVVCQFVGKDVPYDGFWGIPIYMLDLRKTQPGPVTDWANEPHVFLLYGLGGEDLSIPGPLKQWFDVIIQIEHTKASHRI